MTWLEIVNFRTAGKADFLDALKLCCHIQQNLEAEGMIYTHVYRNANYETDLSIHLCWDSAMRNPAKSYVGLQMSESLSHFGLTNHNVFQPVKTDKYGVNS